MKEPARKQFATFFTIFLIVLVFTFIDFLFHLISPEYAVPDRYFRNKIIFATIYSYIMYFLLRKLKPALASFILSIVVVTLLQVRYYFEGYGNEFVFLFLLIHFFILWPLMWAFLKYKDKIIK